MSVDERLGVVTDADNTLWDTDRVYIDAQLWLLEQVENQVHAQVLEEDRLGYVRAIDQLLAKQHHAGLRYPSILLVMALGSALSGAPRRKAVDDALVSTARREADEC